MKDRIWNSSSSINQNAARNRFEFLSDGGNWRTASEEDAFACLPSGDLVHPATWMRAVSVYKSQSNPIDVRIQQNMYISKYMKDQVRSSHLFAQIREGQALHDYSRQESIPMSPAVLLPKSSKIRLLKAPQVTR